MKKILLIFITLVLLLCGCTNQNSKPQFIDDNHHNQSNSNQETYVKSVWITYYELSSMIGNKSADDFEKDVKKAFNELIDMGFNTVTVHIRPCADAFYQSKFYPSSKYCFGQHGATMPYDPFLIMCNVAEQLNLRIEAWINPYRVSQDNNIDALSDTNIAKIWYHDQNKSSNVYISDNSIHFNPASADVTELIVNGVKEVVVNYKIDAIHFDDYFYPTTDKQIDALQYQNYNEDGGQLSLDDWRRDNVNKMVKSVYDAIKSVNKDVLFGISPSANIENNYYQLYADALLWAKEDGYIDYICPQVYYGFKNETQPFMFTTKRWVSETNKDLYIGLPLYKSNKTDEFASATDLLAINEFCDNDNIISRQINYVQKIKSIKGFYIFSYSNLFDENCKTEVDNMLKIMQSNNQD